MSSPKDQFPESLLWDFTLQMGSGQTKVGTVRTQRISELALPHILWPEWIAVVQGHWTERQQMQRRGRITNNHAEGHCCLCLLLLGPLLSLTDYFPLHNGTKKESINPRGSSRGFFCTFSITCIITVWDWQCRVLSLSNYWASHPTAFPRNGSFQSKHQPVTVLHCFGPARLRLIFKDYPGPFPS